MSADSTRTSDARHDLDDKALGQYLLRSGNIPDIQLPIVTTKIGYGQSNPTYFLDDAAGARFVLRKKPPGKVISPVAHQVDREFRVLQALGSVKDFPVPRVFTLCTDPSIIGTAFYVMEFVKGRIITDPELGELSPGDRRKAWFSAIETLAWLHSIDPDAIGLGSYGKKTGFYARHCNTFSRIEAQQAAVKDGKTGKPLGRAHEKYDEMVDYVRSNLPGERYVIVHGDFKFDNLSHCHSGLGIVHHRAPPHGPHIPHQPFLEDYTRMGGPTQSPSESPYKPGNRKTSGMPEPQELLDHYAEIIGFDLRKDGGGRDWDIALIFQYIRGGTISHGIQARAISGQASSDFSHLYFSKTAESLNAAFNRMKALKGQEGHGPKL